jgi:DNA (cytosine-5)-methyltransferase 1
MLKLISLFSGGGGLDCGLEAVGFESRFCSDIDRHSCVTLRYMRLRAHLGAKGGLKNAAVVHRDINDLKSEEILKKARLKKGEADLLVGGPPCQSFSVFGKRQGLNDPRGKLVWQYLRILHDVQPKVFLFENVPGLLTIEGGDVFKNFLEAVQKPFDGKSYTVKKYVLEAARYGVPQFRTRVIVLGVLNGIGLPEPPELPPFETHCEEHKIKQLDRNLIPFNTVFDALQNLPRIAAENAPRNHVGRVHSEPIINRYRNLAFGERDSSTRINKLHPERPSYTIIVGSDKGGGKGHVHPFDPREVTPRESARMQSFPDWWGFSGTSRHPIRQIGNAVPPILAATIGIFIIEEIFGQKSPKREDVLKTLGQDHLLTAENKKIKDQFDEQSSQDNLHKQPEQQEFRRLLTNRERYLGL